MASLTPIRAWIIAARPQTLTAVMAPVLIGGALAHADGVFALLPFMAALFGGMLIQIGTNIANDYFDFVKGADTTQRLGGLRVTQAGLLSPKAVRRGMWIVFTLATAVGVYLVAIAGWPIVAIGIASIAAGVAYTAGPFPIGYLGLGDLFSFVFFGPIAVAGTYYVQALRFAGHTLLAGIGIGALVTAILVVNNLRDERTDRAAGKRTLAVRIGSRWTRVEYVMLLVVGAVVPILGWRGALWSAGGMLAVAALLLAWPPLRIVSSFVDPRELNVALGGTARLVGAYGLAFAFGLLLV